MGDAERERRREPDRAGDLGDRLGDHLLRGFEIGQDGGRPLIIGLPDAGRLGASRGASQEPRAEALLEPGDAAGKDRLRQPDPLGGAGERPGLDDADEGEDVDEVGRTAPPTSHHGTSRARSSGAKCESSQRSTD